MSSNYLSGISVNSPDYREYQVYLMLSASQISFKNFIPCTLHALVNPVFVCFLWRAHCSSFSTW